LHELVSGDKRPGVAAPDPLVDARAAGVRVEIAGLGDWFPVTLLSEYEPATRKIRVSAAVLRRICRRLGAAELGGFLRAAVAHELYHHEVAEGRIASELDRPAGECAAERFVRDRYGIDAARYERALR